MGEILGSGSLFALALTLGAYLFGLWCQSKLRVSLCNPILIGAIIVPVVLLIVKIPAETFQQSTALFSWLLTPATVCLALPMYEQLKILRKKLPVILASVTAGTLVSLAFIAIVGVLLKLDYQTLVSLLPKSVTSAISMPLAEQNGGISALATISVVITGIFGSLIAPAFCKLLKLTDPVSQGVAIGTSSHLAGTSKATEMGELQGAVSTVALSVAGILTAILFPFVVQFI